jgi:putative ABC transport system substrate-binding protein
VRQIGILMASTAEDDPVQQALVAGFRQELEKLGWADGRNARIVGRFAAGNVDRVRRYTAELVV